MKRLLITFLFLAVLSTIVPAALAQEATTAPAPNCTVIANGDVTAYDNADTTSQSFPLSAGDGGFVIGETADQKWVGFDPGIAQAGNLGLTRLKWVQTEDVTLSGDCGSLPVIDPPPMQGCYLTFGSDVNVYAQPDSSAQVSTTLGAKDYASLAGQQSNGWYGWSNPGASAGSTGTIQLKWIQDSDQVQVNGDCEKLTTFYPAPKLSGDICTVLTGDSANDYTQPSTDSTKTALPGLEVQVLAKSADNWYGFDPADAQDGEVGVTRLRWIQASDADQTNGDCADVPVVSSTPTLLSQKDSGTSVTVHVGDTIAIALPGSSTAWMATPSTGTVNDQTILQQQGAPLQGKDGIEVTYQAFSAGETTLSLTSAASDATPSPEQSFSLDVTVQ